MLGEAGLGWIGLSFFPGRNRTPRLRLAVAFRVLPIRSMAERTFARRYCAKHGLLPNRYEQVVIWRSLHLGARVPYPLLACHPGYFSADRALVQAASRCPTVVEFDVEVADYPYHPENRNFLRGSLKPRLSVRRLRRLVREVLPAG